jgi:hypothetical protein
MHRPSDHIANIGVRERRQRYVMGLIMLGVSAGLLVLLGRSEVSRWWRSLLVVPLWASMLGFVQARTQT